MDPEIQTKDDVFKHIFIYATFEVKVVGKMTAYPILNFTQGFIKFQCMVSKIQMKRAKRLLLTYLLTYLLTCLLTNQVIESA